MLYSWLNVCIGLQKIWICWLKYITNQLNEQNNNLFLLFMLTSCVYSRSRCAKIQSEETLKSSGELVRIHCGFPGKNNLSHLQHLICCWWNGSLVELQKSGPSVSCCVKTLLLWKKSFHWLRVVCLSVFTKLCRIRAGPMCPAHHSSPRANKCCMESVMWKSWRRVLQLLRAAHRKREEEEGVTEPNVLLTVTHPSLLWFRQHSRCWLRSVICLLDLCALILGSSCPRQDHVKPSFS